MSHNRDGKPTAFQIASLRKAGLSLKGIKTYRDAENALARVKRAAKNGAKAAAADKKPSTKKPAAKAKPADKKQTAPRQITVKPTVKNDGKTISVKGNAAANAGKTVSVNGEVRGGKPKSVEGIGVFSVHLDKADVIEALLLGFAKSIISIVEAE